MLRTYCYSSLSGGTIDEMFPAGEAPKEITRDGVTFVRDMAAEWRTQTVRVKEAPVKKRKRRRKDEVRKKGKGTTKPCGTWPRISTSLGVGVDQVPDAMAASRRHGVPTDYTTDGDAIITSPGHEKALAASMGLANKSGSKLRQKRRTRFQPR